MRADLWENARLEPRFRNLPTAMNTPNPKSIALIGLGFLVPMLASRASRKLAGKGYRLITHREVPKNPADPDVAWREALAWAAVSGLVGGMARLAARRWLAGTAIPSKGDDMDEETEKLA